jgi:tripartite-type tricarboxylate transporter receptor subunit TctC
MMLSRRSFGAATAALATVRAAGSARADTYPSHIVKIIVPISAGSTTDVVARQVGEGLRLALGQTFLVDNRPGAGGTIGSAAVAKAPADGYTLLVVSASHTANPAIYASLPYDTLKDFKGITRLAIAPLILVTSPSKNLKSVAELVARAKARPGEMTYGSGGVGSAAHMNAEQFRAMAGFEALHVPYRGTPEMMADVIAGRVDFGFISTVTAIGSLNDGKLVALACGAEQRSSLLPDVPTTVEAGVPNSSYDSWLGMFTTGGTPPEIVQILNRETVKVLQAPETVKKLAAMGADVAPMADSDFDAFVAKDLAKIAALVKLAKIPVN